MSSISSLLNKKNAAIPTTETPQILTGIEGSVAAGTPGIDPSVRPLESIAPAPAAQFAEGEYPEGTYRALKLKQIIRANGTKFKADANGMYVPKSQEDADLLHYFATERFGLVEAI